MIDAASSMRAQTLLRRHLTATILLGVFAGIAGGAALVTWAAARRTDTAYDRFVAYEDAATYSIMACPVGVNPEDDYEPCRTADQADVADFVRTLPGVESAGRWTFAIAAGARAEQPDDWARLLVPFALDDGALPALGRPLVIEGQLADQRAADEAVINEAMAEGTGLRVGDQVVITVVPADQFDTADELLEKPTGIATTMTVVGIVRRPGDLTVRPFDDTIVDNLGRVEATRAWADVLHGDFARYGTGIVVRSRDLSGDDIVAAIRRHWPGRAATALAGQPTVARDPSSVLDALRLQSTATLLLAAAIGAAALVFAGQAIARQARREWNDSAILAALGMTRGGMFRASIVRALPISAIAAAVSFGVLVAASPIGPVGLARKAEPFPGFRVDVVVAVTGVPSVAVVSLLFAALPIALLQRPDRAVRGGSRRAAPAALISPTLEAGLAMTRSRRAGGLALGSAVAGVAIAAATGIAAWELTTSYDTLVETPVRYGAAWDAQVGNVSTDAQHEDVVDRLGAIPGIRVARILSLSGEAPEPGFTILAGVSVVGQASFGEVTHGRPPTTSDEVALGRDTMHELDAGIGDSVTLPLGGGDLARRFRVVGEAVLNDGFEAQPGLGALVTPAAFAEIAPTGDGSTYVVWVDDGVDRTSTLAAVRAAFPTTYVEPRPTDEIGNVRLVAGQPRVLTLIVGVLAGAALVHTLVTSVRRNRRQIGVLKTLGFTRRQVVSSVGWHATTIAGAALAVGVPLGIVAGRVAWRAISNSLGVETVQSRPLAAIVATAALVLIVANIAAFAPGVSAARTRPSSALRAE